MLINSQFGSLRQYGEMTTLQMGSRTWVVLNTKRVASEIISKRGSLTHERPVMPVSSGLVSKGNRTVLRQTADWTEGRRVMHQLLSGHVLKTYGDWQEQESVRLLIDYLREPTTWYQHHYRYTSAVMYRIVFGETMQRSTADLDIYQKVTVEFIESMQTNLIDFIPYLASLPRLLQPWRARWERMGDAHHTVFRSWWDPIKAAIANDTAPPSFVRDILLDPETKYTGSDEEAMYLATSIVSAGSDNTRMTMNTFVMAALTQSSAFARARAEIDDLCGDTQRLPMLADMRSLPFVCGMVKEVLRWRPVVPFVPPHRLVQDLEFEGYTFPAGTDFIINNMAIGLECEAPNEFRPERWMADGMQETTLHEFWQFGGGRRVCVGYKLAQQELFIAMARLIYCFDFVEVCVPILICSICRLTIFQAGLVNSKVLNHASLEEPFPVKVSIRSEKHRQLIIDAAKRAGISDLPVKTM